MGPGFVLFYDQWILEFPCYPKLTLDQARCNHCNACHDVCPMGVHFNESPDDMECISCLACTKACKLNAITIEIGGVPVSGRTKVPKRKSTRA